MVCNVCGNEIGSARQCPYCGNLALSSGRFRVPNGSYATMPVQWTGSGQDSQATEHLRNLDRWGLIGVILLFAIFAIDLLRLLLMLA